MSLHVAVLPSPDHGGKGKKKAEDGERIALLAAYEDGRVELWACPLPAFLERPTEWDGRKASDGLWTRVWEGKAHNEAGESHDCRELTTVMAMTVDREFARAFTVSADHRVVCIDLASVSREVQGMASAFQRGLRG